MDESEDGNCVRFFQWVDDRNMFTHESICARLLDQPNRKVRNAEEPEDPYTQGKIFMGSKL
jgi:hypothetical protein